MADKTVVTGVPELDAALTKMKVATDAGAFTFVSLAAELVNNKAKSIFIGGNEADATDAWRSDAWPIPTRRTGQLQASIRASSPKREGVGTWSITTGPRTVYGRRIELGYTGKGYFPYYTTRPFPFLKPAMEDSEDALEALFERIMLAAQGV